MTKIQMSQVMNGPQHSINWPKQNQDVAQTIWTFAYDWIMTDGMRKLAQRFSAFSNRTYPNEPYALLKNHPLFCGTIETSLRFLTRETGLALAMGWGTLLSVAHLYNLLRQTRILATPCPDMELFIDLHTLATLFVGALLTTLEDCYKRYTLILGLSVENFARDKNWRYSKCAISNPALETGRILPRLCRLSRTGIPSMAPLPGRQVLLKLSSTKRTLISGTCPDICERDGRNRIS